MGKQYSYHYFHLSEHGCTLKIVKVPAGKYPKLDHGVCCGPYNSFTEAKKDAVDFHTCDKNEALMAIKMVKQMRLKDIEHQEGE